MSDIKSWLLTKTNIRTLWSVDGVTSSEAMMLPPTGTRQGPVSLELQMASETTARTSGCQSENINLRQFSSPVKPGYQHWKDCEGLLYSLSCIVDLSVVEKVNIWDKEDTEVRSNHGFFKTRFLLQQ